MRLYKYKIYIYKYKKEHENIFFKADKFLNIPASTSTVTFERVAGVALV